MNDANIAELRQELEAAKVIELRAAADLRAAEAWFGHAQMARATLEYAIASEAAPHLLETLRTELGPGWWCDLVRDETLKFMYVEGCRVLPNTEPSRQVQFVLRKIQIKGGRPILDEKIVRYSRLYPYLEADLRARGWRPDGEETP